ncbi:MAG: adenylate/guanylate cyclase domain-containing protein [Thermoplasmata archaeon]
MASTRRLSAIMFTDMVGSTSSAQENESEALRLRDEQAELVRPLFAAHQGREIKSMGDGFLSEFGSALRAVQCAIDIQQHLHERNSQPGTPPIQLRIGIHLGDVEQRESDIFGDAVNIASRIEPLAAPGGVCISGEVFSQIRNKIPNTLEKLPPTSLKGIRVSIDVYRVLLPWNGRDVSVAASGPTPLDTNRIAVLPFVSMSPDPNDEYFADGLTEELIANLALVKGLKVIARTSIMEYKKKEKHVSEIGKELGVGTIVEGSVRKAANRIRVTVQVIDVATEEHLWASKYDDNLDDVFAVQSDIATKVAASLPSNLAYASAPAPTLLGARDMQAYLYFLQGQALVWKREEEPIRQALRLFEQAVERDPMFSRAYASLAQAYKQLGQEGLISWSEAIVQGRVAAEKAVSISPDLAEAHSMLAELMFMADDPTTAQEKEARRALELNPNLAEAHDILGQIAGVRGDLENYVRHIEAAYRLDPLSPPTIRYLGRAYFFAQRYDEAVEFWKRTLHLDPLTSYNGLSDYYLAKGDRENAREMVKEMQRVAPTSRATYLKRGYLAALDGDKATALEMIAKLDAAHKEGWVTSPFAGYIYIALGDPDKFFDYMYAAVKSHTLPVTTLLFAPMLAEARKDPRLEQVISLDRQLNP